MTCSVFLVLLSRFGRPHRKDRMSPNGRPSPVVTPHPLAASLTLANNHHGHRQEKEEEEEVTKMLKIKKLSKNRREPRGRTCVVAVFFFNIKTESSDDDDDDDDDVLCLNWGGEIRSTPAVLQRAF